MNKVTIAVGLLIAICTGYLNFLDHESRWMLFNQSDAEDYAIALIQGDNSFKPEDKFIDYITNMKDGYVLFTEHHNSEITFGYFPDNQKALDDKELSWTRLEGDWFYSRLEFRNN